MVGVGEPVTIEASVQASLWQRKDMTMVTKFEAGKKYTYQYSNDKYLCVGFDKNGETVLENTKTGNLFRNDGVVEYYQEYKEPVVHTRYIHWYIDSAGQIIATMERKSNCPDWIAPDNYIGVDKVTRSVEG